MRVQGIIFDFDGTLADTLQHCCNVFRDVTRDRLGRDYTDAEIMAMFGPSEEGIFQRIAGDQWQVCLDDFLTIYERDHATGASIFPGIAELLAELAERGTPVGIVTGKGAASAEISLRLFELAEHFDVVESGSPEGSVKPAAIRRIVDGWGLDPATVAYVGDAPTDVSDARQAGVIPLAAAWAELVDREALEARDPAVMFGSVAEFAGWIRQNSSIASKEGSDGE